MKLEDSKMAAVFHRRHHAEKLRELSASLSPFSEALPSSLRLEHLSSASVGWIGFGRVARLSFQTNYPFQTAVAILSTLIQSSTADS